MFLGVPKVLERVYMCFGLPGAERVCQRQRRRPYLKPSGSSVGLCFGRRAVGCMHTDHVSPAIPQDRPRPKPICISDAIQRAYWCFWSPAVERVHVDRVDADFPPDSYPIQNLCYTSYLRDIYEKVYMRFGRPVIKPVRAVHVGAASLQDQYPTQNPNYLGAMGCSLPNACTSTTSAPASRQIST
ncbi:hypothetical protein B0H14DRAFT_3168710 [Mycena olivaceomarginata]|nr:hypothetical protein B0H14DRAFT_3168710 [Mycena olivaceomarginata]